MVLGIRMLEVHRLQFDLICCYKIISGIVAVDCNDIFTLNALSKTRSRL